MKSINQYIQESILDNIDTVADSVGLASLFKTWALEQKSKCLKSNIRNGEINCTTDKNGKIIFDDDLLIYDSIPKQFEIEWAKRVYIFNVSPSTLQNLPNQAEYVVSYDRIKGLLKNLNIHVKTIQLGSQDINKIKNCHIDFSSTDKSVKDYSMDLGDNPIRDFNDLSELNFTANSSSHVKIDLSNCPCALDMIEKYDEKLPKSQSIAISKSDSEMLTNIFKNCSGAVKINLSLDGVVDAIIGIIDTDSRCLVRGQNGKWYYCGEYSSTHNKYYNKLL